MLIPLDDSRLYVNREVSLLAFQHRVLEEARDESNPLLERVKFLSIVGSNLDEFFMVRVAALKQQIDGGIQEPGGPDGFTPIQALEKIREEYLQLLALSHETRESLFSELSRHGIRVPSYAELTPAQRDFADDYYRRVVHPVLIPLAFDPARPFPHISNLSLNLSISIHVPGSKQPAFARLKIPDTLSQLVPLQAGRGRSGAVSFVWLEEVVRANLPHLFPGREIIESHVFHVTRDADISIQELEAADLLESVEEGVKKRRFGAVTRLMVNPEMPESLLGILTRNMDIEDIDVYRVEGPLGLSRLRGLLALDRPELKDAPFVPVFPEALRPAAVYSTVRQGDVLVHHPFDSFMPVVEFLRNAAEDPDVLAIKMTLYRVGRNSPIVQALLSAMEYGKQVAVLVELKARFDEESNIEWARALEAEGVHVVYGVVGLKVHAKVAMVVRREDNAIRRYVHLSTGNYNAVTANLYTDLGFFTCDEEIGEDATDLFNFLTGYSAKTDYRKLLVAPVNLRQRLESLIEREIQHARSGQPAAIIIKVNSLVDDRMIRLFYEASQAGVSVDLLVRGICCLRPGIPGVSDNIRVRSIVGRFLEHSRIFYFRNGGEEQVYLGSADLMPRNINRRVEVLFPVETPAQVRFVRDRVLDAYLRENVKARAMNSDGTYTRVLPAPGEEPLNSQLALMKMRP
jgi:polyphosphate kinase